MYKILWQSEQWLGKAGGTVDINTPVIIYTVPVNKAAEIYINVTSLIDGTDESKLAKYSLHIVKAWDTPQNKNSIAYFHKIKWSETRVYPDKWYISLEAWDSVQIYMKTPDKLSFNIFGTEIDSDRETRERAFWIAMTSTTWPATDFFNNRSSCPCPAS